MKAVFKAALAIWVATVSSAAQAAVPSAHQTHVSAQPLPSSRLEFGLANTNLPWMTSSGVPWRYRFAYLAGGTNTPSNWLTWQDPAKPPGQYALDYMTNSTTSPANYIPVFTWYQLLQSTPSTGSNELDRDYSNLNNASTMSSYYGSFKILMQKAAQYGGQVVVHIEPDFWGYMQQKAAGAGASSVPAMVKSSGFAEAASFPDNLVGFASALKSLRDTYAPNALLAMHASMWSSSIDLASNTDPNLNVPGEADKTAAFLNLAGEGSWDALFNDLDDHDAAWWELASCSTPPCVNQYFTHWWDATNVKFPNFARYESWVGELHAQTLKPQVVWQVPMGNQYFLTMNNTCGHYQDNVAPYFIAHPTELFNAGLVAVMFGAGNACQTTNEDDQKDGITNGGGVPITDALGVCYSCNTHTSVYADDDGGFLRIFVGNYYAGLVPCSGVNVTQNLASPQVPGPQVVLTAAATACSGPQYEFWLKLPSGIWTLVQSYSGLTTFTWVTAGKPAGTYRFSVWARDTSSFNSYDAFSAFDYVLSSASCSGITASAAPASSAGVGTPVTVTGSASGCPNPLYQFWLLPPSGGWGVAQSWSTTATFTWRTAGLAAGSYRFSVWVHDASSTAAYDAFNAFDYTLTVTSCSGMSAGAAPPSSASVTTTVMVTGTANGCSNPLYQFYLLPPNGTWTLLRLWSANPTLSWNTTSWPAGTYRFSVWARDASSSAAYDSFSAFQYVLTITPCTGMSASAVPANTASRGTNVIVTGSATGCGSPQYEFWLKLPNGTWTLARGWSSSASFTWTTTTGTAAGMYRFSVWARDASSSASYDAFDAVDYTLT